MHVLDISYPDHVYYLAPNLASAIPSPLSMLAHCSTFGQTTVTDNTLLTKAVHGTPSEPMNIWQKSAMDVQLLITPFRCPVPSPGPLPSHMASRGATASLAANEAKRTDTIQISELLWSETFTTKNPSLKGSSS
ncbi:hypothetical protein MHYP_G00040280 [Metynnis hypsauchen]